MDQPPAAAPVFAGIDVSKDRLDVHLRPSGRAFAVPRDGPGLERLAAELRALVPALIVLEATGGFEVTVAAALAGAGLPLAVVNPRQIRNFARATGRLAKTDRLDAEAIALFAERVRPEPRPVPDEDAQALAELVARRRQIIDMIVMEQNRRRQARSPKVRRTIDATVEMLQAQLAALDGDIDAAVRGCPAWREAEDLLKSVRVSATSPPEPSSPNSPSSATPTAAASPPSSASLPSTATAGRCAASPPSPAAGPACATCSS